MSNATNATVGTYDITLSLDLHVPFASIVAISSHIVAALLLIWVIGRAGLELAILLLVIKRLLWQLWGRIWTYFRPESAHYFEPTRDDFETRVIVLATTKMNRRDNITAEQPSFESITTLSSGREKSTSSSP